jgi:HPt (histidine-containing phosphotransfer) domain-containing protein
MVASIVVGIIAGIIALIIYREYHNEKKYRKERQRQQERKEKKLTPKVTKRPTGSTPKPTKTSIGKPASRQTPPHPKPTPFSPTDRKISTTDKAISPTQSSTTTEKPVIKERKNTHPSFQTDSLQPKPDLKTKPSATEAQKQEDTTNKIVKTRKTIEKGTIEKTGVLQQTTASKPSEKQVPQKKASPTEKKSTQPDLIIKTTEKKVSHQKPTQIKIESSTELPKKEYPDFNYERLMEMGLSKEDALEFIQELIPQIGTQIPLLDEALQIPDFEEMEHLTHSIKGSSTTIGTGGVSDLLVEYNTYLKTNAKVEVAQTYQKLLKHYFEKLKKQFPPKS